MEQPSEVRSDPTDGRNPGSWESRYSGTAWLQIIFELTYLILILAVSGSALIYIGICITGTLRTSTFVVMPTLASELHREFIQWVVVVLAGIVGGIVFDLKWLYHSVAKGLWSRDRVLWRLLVPLISGVVSVFLAFIIVSGLLPFIRNETFRTTYFALGFGFLFGYFSDNVIAALQNFAKRYIGTTNSDDTASEQ